MNLKSSFWYRSSKLFHTSSTIALQELVLFLKNKTNKRTSTESTRIKQATQLIQTLGELKGTALKLGQILAIELSHLFTEEVQAAFDKVYIENKPMPFNEIKKTLKELYGNKFNTLKINSKPIAVASFSQVHTGYIDNSKVIFKIQYPGIHDTIDSDLKILSSLFKQFLRLSGHIFDLQDTIADISSKLKKELNYKNDANNIHFLANHLKNNSKFRVPQVFTEWSNKTILVLSYEEGIHLNQIFTHKSILLKEHIANSLVELLYYELFIWKIIQADANIENFLYDTHTNQLVLLDFGAVDYINDNDAILFKETLNSIFHSQDSVSFLQSQGLILNHENENYYKALTSILNFCSQFLAITNQPISFNAPINFEPLRTNLLNLFHYQNSKNSKTQYLFFDRKCSGILNILSRIGEPVDFYKIYLKFKQQ